MNTLGGGKRWGSRSLRTSQSQEPKISSGMLGLQGTAAVKGKHKTRKENAPATNCPPTPSAPGSPQLLTHPQNISGQVHKAGQWESPLPRNAVIFLSGNRRTVLPRIPDSTRFNWKQQSRGQIWVWGGDDNEK